MIKVKNCLHFSVCNLKIFLLVFQAPKRQNSESNERRASHDKGPAPPPPVPQLPKVKSEPPPPPPLPPFMSIISGVTQGETTDDGDTTSLVSSSDIVSLPPPPPEFPTHDQESPPQAGTPVSGASSDEMPQSPVRPHLSRDSSREETLEVCVRDKISEPIPTISLVSSKQDDDSEDLKITAPGEIVILSGNCLVMLCLKMVGIFMNNIPIAIIKLLA